MPRNMSFMLTKEQYRSQTKTVTRRGGKGMKGWPFLKPGDICNGAEKCQGLKKGEKMVRLGQHRIISTRFEPIRRMTDEPEYGKEEVAKEGFPEMTPADFVVMYCKHNRCSPEFRVNRIEFEYVFTKPPQSRAPWTEEQVRNLKARQARVDLHPYTCTCGKMLQPVSKGWRCSNLACPEVNPVQTWAWAQDANQGGPAPFDLFETETHG